MTFCKGKRVCQMEGKKKGGKLIFISLILVVGLVAAAVFVLPKIKNEKSAGDESTVPSTKAEQVAVEETPITVIGKGVQVSANNSAFTSVITLNDIKGTSDSEFKAYAGNENNYPASISPVCLNLRSWNAGYPSFFEAGIEDSGSTIYAKSIPSDAGSKYIAFDVFVKSDSSQKIYWDGSTVSCTVRENGLADIRMAVINCGTVSENDESRRILNTRPSNADNNRAVMYEPMYERHPSQVYLAKEFSGLPIPAGVVEDINGTYTGLFDGARVTDEDKNKAYFDAEQGINRIRIYLWIEGNDPDCGYSFSSLMCNMNLVFEAK